MSSDRSVPTTRDHGEVVAGDPFAYAGGLHDPGECPACYRGVVFLTYEEDGHEWTEPVPCRRCS